MSKVKGERFGVVLMNPPYQNNLHLKFLVKVNNLAHCIVSVQPYTWLEKHTIWQKRSLYKKYFKDRITDIEYIKHRKANDIFNLGNAIESLGIFVLSDNSSNYLDLDKMSFSSDTEYNLYRKVLNPHNDNRLFWENENTQRKGPKKDYEVVLYTWHAGETCYDAAIRTDGKNRSVVLYFNSENEKENFLNSLKTNFMNWYYKNIVAPGDYKLVAYMFMLKDYTKPVSDKTFYKIFNLTDEEIQIIENFNKQDIQ